MVNPLRGDVRADVSESERLPRAPPPAAHPLAAESVVEIAQLGGRNPEFVPETPHQILGGRDEYVHRLANLADMRHAAAHPIRPINCVPLALIGRARKVARVAADGAFSVVLPVAKHPFVGGFFRVHLDELPARTHEPVVVEREHHWHAAPLGGEDERCGQMVEMPDVDDVRAQLGEQAREGVVDGGVSVSVPSARHVDDVERHAGVGGVRFVGHGVLRRKPVLAPREDMDFMPLRERLRQALRIDFRPGVVAHRIAVYDFDDFHVGGSLAVASC